MMIDIYNSMINKWTELKIPSINSVWPQGDGIYSYGKFYFLNELNDGECVRIVSFDGDHK